LGSGGSEGVCFENVGARVAVFRVDLAHQVRIAEAQLIVATINIYAFSVEHRTHRPVEDVDPVGIKKVSERLHFPSADWRLLLRTQGRANQQSAITIPKLRSPALKQRGTSLILKFSGLVLSGLPVLFSRLFYVAA